LNYNPLKAINDPLKLIMIHYLFLIVTEIKATKSHPQAFSKGPLGLPKASS